jgi:hypothetical protein
MKPISGKEFTVSSNDTGGRFSAFTVATTSMESPQNVVRLSVPVHGSSSLKAGLLRHLMKMAEESDLQ